MRKSLFFVCIFFCSAAFALTPDFSTPLNYNFRTHLQTRSTSSFNFIFTEQIDFQCQIKSISPIDQTPEKVTIIFKRIRGETNYNDQKLYFDTNEQDNYSLEFQSLKKLLNQPISIDLNRDMTIQKPNKNFDQLLHFSSLEDHFISYDLLDQMIGAIFIPLKAAQSSSSCQFFFYFPFKTEKSFPIQLKESPSQTSFHIDQPLELVGLYSTQKDPFSICLNGKLHANGKWFPNSLYTQKFSLQHDLKEKNKETLFERPLVFNYSVDLNLAKLDD